jgi:hypothetical protein
MTLQQRNQYLLPKNNNKNNQTEQQQLHSSRLFPRLLTLANPGRRSCIQMPTTLWWVGGYPLGYTMLMPYGAEMWEKIELCAAVNALDF